MIPRRFVEYDYIFEVYEGEIPFNSGQEYVYSTLEDAGCVAASERPTYKAIETMVGCECSLIFISIINLDCQYPLLASEVQRTVFSQGDSSICSCVVSHQGPVWLQPYVYDSRRKIEDFHLS